MTTTVTQKNMVTIPAEILVRMIPDRGELARRLLGTGRKFSPDRDAVAELVEERTKEAAWVVCEDAGLFVTKPGCL